MFLKTTHDMLNCRFTNLPTEILTHSLQHMNPKLSSGGVSYINCLKDHYSGSYQSSNFCKMLLSKAMWPHCGAPSVRHDSWKCHCLLRHKETHYGLDLPSNCSYETHTPQQVALALQRHSLCMEKYTKAAQRCFMGFQDKCLLSSIRSFKDIRLSMSMIEQLLEKDRNIKVIWNMRDPRGIVVGRRRNHLLSEVSGQDIKKEAESLCAKIRTHDIPPYIRIQQKYKNAVFVDTLEDRAVNPLQTLSDTYTWLGRTLPDRLRYTWELNTVNSSKYKSDTDKWRAELTKEENEHIYKVCGDVMTFFRYLLWLLYIALLIVWPSFICGSSWKKLKKLWIRFDIFRFI